MQRVRGSTLAALAVAAFAALACRPGARLRQAPAGARESSENVGGEAIVGPARLIPDVTAATPGALEVLPDGTRRLLVAGMRVLERPDGRLERARQLLPNAPTRLLELPDRLGGGLLFYASVGATTHMWRAKSWMDRLEPLAEIWGQVVDVAPGFDRLYARLDTGDFKAVDPQSGKQWPLDPLPKATRVGEIAFADPWRAVAITDFRGALATFDAGGSWRPVPLGGRSVNDVWLRDGDFILDNQRERWRLASSGELVKEEGPPESSRPPSTISGDVPSRAPAASRDWSALPETYGSARRPLRAAVEDGWPAPFEGHASTAVVAQSGALFRVDLADGAILEWRGEAFRGDDGTCHAVRLGAGFGFVCAAETGGTSLYVFDPPFGVREVARFASPRRVVPSGNGAAVIYGSCDRAAKRGNSDVLCFWWPSGTEREVRAPAAIRHGARPVALSDGRAAFVAPGGESGGIAVLLGRGDGWISIPVATAERDARLRRAQWLDGIEERDLGVLSGWLLFDTELRGARVHLDGKIEVGVGVADVERASVAGRYAVDWGLSGRGAETVDGGMTWTPIDLPPSDLPQPARPVTSCGPAGSAHNGWIRVGWGAGRTPDLALAAAPKASRIALAPARGVSLRCELTGQLTGPGAPPVRPNEGAWQPSAALPAVSPPFPLTLTQPLPKSPPSGPLVLRLARPSILAGAPSGLPPSSWSPFRGSPPPALQSGEEGIEAGTDPQVTMQARIYAWGPRGAEWSRLSQVQARFDDRFDLYGTHITRATGGFWADEDRAADALGLLPAHTVNWAALLDPSGVAALLFAQTGAGRADLYAAAQGEPLVPWRNAEGGSLPVPSSAVRLGPTWFFLATSMSSGAWVLSVYRVDGGVARRLARLPRVPAPPSEAGPKLMRRAGGDGLGLLVQGAPGFEQTIRDWYVLPLDPTTGDLGEPIRLVGSDLEGRVPERCAADADVWWVNTELTLSPAVQVVGPPLASLSAIEMRLGLGPGTACVVAMAARGERLSSASTPPPDAESLAGLPIPMTATDSATGRRWLLRCGAP